MLQILSEVLQPRTAVVLARDEYRRELETVSRQKQVHIAEQDRYRDQVRIYEQVYRDVKEHMDELSGTSEWEYILPYDRWFAVSGRDADIPTSASAIPRAVRAALRPETIEAVIAYGTAANAAMAADQDLEAIQSRAESQARQELTAEASLRGRLLTGVWAVLTLGCLVAAAWLGGAVRRELRQARVVPPPEADGF